MGGKSTFSSHSKNVYMLKVDFFQLKYTDISKWKSLNFCVSLLFPV